MAFQDTASRVPMGAALSLTRGHLDFHELWRRGWLRRLTHFSVGQTFDFDWSHDHKRLVMTRGQVTRDVVLIQHFQSSP